MTLLAIVAYPSLEESDREWIEGIRTTGDPQASRIGVHFTLVFPVEESVAEVAAGVSAVAASARPISFTIRRATVVQDAPGGGGYVSLVPNEGRDEMTELHDRLYGGVLRRHLRPDIPFIPHMTIAAAPDLERCRVLAESLIANCRIIHGRLSRVELVNVAATPVKSIESFALGNSGSTPV